MTPVFPAFKLIDLEDKDLIESYTRRLRPYSDFNFTNVWAWNTRNEHLVSTLNDNLVIQFTDYVTNAPFLSFLGTTQTEQTARQLSQFARASGINPVLRLVPEESVAELHTSATIHIEEDAGAFDYIFSVDQLANPSGGKFKQKRHSSNRFEREFPDAVFEVKDLRDNLVIAQVLSVFDRWDKQKKLENVSHDSSNERRALERLLNSVRENPSVHSNVLLSAVFLHGVMFGFGIDELLPNNYALSHFVKADSSFRGIYEFLNKHIAGHLLTQGAALWNWEQDLSIKGLHEVKESYRPVNYLRKYSISEY